MDFTEAKKPITVTIDCYGEATGLHYEGTFVCKRFLTHADKVNVALTEERLCRGVPRMPRYSMDDVFLGVLPTLRDMTQDDKKLNEAAQKIMWSVAVLIPPECSEIANLRRIATAYAHVIDCPEWFRDAEQLPDMKPINALMEEIWKLQRAYAESNQPKQ